MTKHEGLDGGGLTHTNTGLSSWYEAGLPLHERKLRGHFSTPPRLVERILDACGYTPENDLAQMRVLDPACGSGNFLAGAARRLVSFAARQKLSPDALLALASRNLWGFDPDPVSCFLAEMQVKTVLDDAFPPLDADQAQRFALHLHQADGLALPWKNYEGIDLFLANPPYLAAKNTDLSGYRSTHRQGQQDSYLLFLDVALSVVRPGGWLGLVLPDPVLARANAACVRARLLQTCTLHHLWHLSGVFAAQVGAVVLIAQKCPAPATHLVSWKREHWQHEQIVGARLIAPAGEGRQGEHYTHEQFRQPEPDANADNTVPQTLFQRQPGAELRYLLSREQGSLVERLREQLEYITASEHRLAPLGDFLTIRRGEELGRKSQLLVRDNGDGDTTIADRATSRSRATARVAPTMIRAEGASPRHGRGDPCGRPENGRVYGGGHFPVLLGGVDVKPYETPVGSCWIAREAVEKPLERYLTPKLLVVKSTDRLQAALDVQGHVVLQTLYVLHLRTGVRQLVAKEQRSHPQGATPPIFPTPGSTVPMGAVEPGVGGGGGWPLAGGFGSPTRLQRIDGHPVRTDNHVGDEAELDELYFFLALLNSRVLREYVYVLHTAYKWVQPQMEQHVLARLPVPLVAREARQEIVERAKRLTQVCSEAGAVVELKQQWEGLYEEQERAIRALYTSVL